MNTQLGQILFFAFCTFFVASCNKKKSEFPFVLSEEVQLNKNNFLWKSIGPLDYKEAEKVKNDRKIVLSHMLSPDIDPYKGVDTNPKKCQLEFLPKPITLSGKDWFTDTTSLYSSSRMILGFCEEERNLLKTQYQILYCGNVKTLFILQYFYSDKNQWIMPPIAKCDNYL